MPAITPSPNPLLRLLNSSKAIVGAVAVIGVVAVFIFAKGDQPSKMAMAAAITTLAAMVIKGITDEDSAAKAAAAAVTVATLAASAPPAATTVNQVNMPADTKTGPS